MSMLMKRTHQVEIEPLEAIEASRRRREPSRVIRTVQTLSTTPDTMSDTPEATGMSVSSKQAHYVKFEGQEVTWMSEPSQEMLGTIR